MAVDIMGIDIGQIVELGTRVAQAGAIRVADVAGDEIFEYLIAVAMLIYEMDPSGTEQ